MLGAKVYGFLAGEEPVTAAKFLSNHTAALEKILEDPHASILFSDLPGDGGVFIARYLRGHYYRNAVLYHLGEFPRVNLADLPTQGGFSSPAELHEALTTAADEVIKM